MATSELAYVLDQWDWSDSSLIVELFSRRSGRVVTVARGAKKPTSNLRALLMPFAPLNLVLGAAPKRKATATEEESSDIQPLRSAEWAGGAPLLPAAALMSAYYLNELIAKLVPRQDPHPVLFDSYADALAALAQEPQDAATLRAFELRLLRELGWLPDLSVATLTTEPVNAAVSYTLSAEGGVVAALAAETAMPGTVWRGLEAALSHGSHAALCQACAAVSGPLRVPLRGLVHYHLGHSRLRTREVLQGVQRLGLREALSQRADRSRADAR
jgi:DNA repair protein RecO (recombination protein O)